MKKNSALEGQKPTDHPWARGDLVKINIHDWDATPHSYMGIIVSVVDGHMHKQIDMFPVIKVFNFNTGEVDKIYSYNLEILSAHQ